MRCQWMLLAAAIAACGFAPAPFPKPKKEIVRPDVKDLQGVWHIESRQLVQATGKATARTGSPVTKVRIEGERWSYVAVEANGAERVTVSYTLSVDNSKAPYVIDCVRETPGAVAAKGRALPPARTTYAMRGVFALDGNTMKMVYRFGSGTVERPESLTNPPVGSTILTLKRMQK